MDLLDGGSALDIQASCKMSCREGQRLTTTQVDEDTVIVAHLPKKFASVKCDSGFKSDINHDVDIGALRFLLGCGCSLWYKNKLVAKSHRKVCKASDQPFLIEHLVPIQISELEDRIPNINRAVIGIKFNNQDIIDEDWEPDIVVEKRLGSQNGWFRISFDLPVFSICFSIWQSAIVCYVMIKLRLGPFACLSVVPQVSAGRSCDKIVSQSEVLILLYVVIVLQVIFILPKIIWLASRKCRNMVNRAVNAEAKRQITQIQNYDDVQEIV